MLQTEDSRSGRAWVILLTLFLMAVAVYDILARPAQVASHRVQAQCARGPHAGTDAKLMRKLHEVDCGTYVQSGGAHQGETFSLR